MARLLPVDTKWYAKRFESSRRNMTCIWRLHNQQSNSADGRNGSNHCQCFSSITKCHSFKMWYSSSPFRLIGAVPLGSYSLDKKIHKDHYAINEASWRSYIQSWRKGQVTHNYIRNKFLQCSWISCIASYCRLNSPNSVHLPVLNYNTHTHT